MNFDIVSNLKWIGEHIWAALRQMGGVAILTVIITFIIHKINTRFEKRIEHKYDQKLEEIKVELDKQRESYKSLLEKRNYVSKVRFDTEFATCKELVRACRVMVDAVYFLFPTHSYGELPIDSKERKDYLDALGAEAIKEYNSCRKLLDDYAPFITKDLYDNMKDLCKLCGNNIEDFRYRYDKDPIQSPPANKDQASAVHEAYKRTRLLDDKLTAISDYLRGYFQNMEILDK